jgi:hypothetical protein
MPPIPPLPPGWAAAFLHAWYQAHGWVNVVAILRHALPH